MSTKPFRILIAPLNWGLGHATRCLPIASAFPQSYGTVVAKTNIGKTDLVRKVEIHWASDGQALELLRAELPSDTLIHELPSYGIRYPTRSASVNMVLGGPKMGAAILQEATAVEALHKQYNYSFILSDNRFGCRVAGVHSAIVTHQVHLPIRNWFSRKLGTMLNHRLLAKFDQVVVPDNPHEPRLAGQMSAPHPRVPTNYIGPISRFSQDASTANGQEITLAIVLSGPEPQRTKLETRLLLELSNTLIRGTTILVRGCPSQAPKIPSGLLENIQKSGNHLEVRDFLGSADLQKVLAKAEMIVTRPGYTTVMDLSVLGRKAIYIPTPGQPEQAWLGKSLAASGAGISVPQSELVLAKAIERFQGMEPGTDSTRMQKGDLLSDWVSETLS